MHIQTININFHGAPSPLASAVLAAFMRGPESDEPDDTNGAAPAPGIIPRIGHIWHGQGGILVGQERGTDERGDPYLILATDKRAIFEKRELGTYGVDVTGANSDTDGLANTIALAEAGSELCKEIRGLVIDGHSDWGLMAPRQAALCYANAPEQFEKEWYLLSKQYSANYAWGQYFSNGGQSSSLKEVSARARVVRRLFL